MNAARMARPSLRAKWPSTPCRKVQSKTPRPKRPRSVIVLEFTRYSTNTTLSPKTAPPRKQLNPNDLQHFQERFAKEEAQKKALGGIPPRVVGFMAVSALAISTYCSYLYASYKREVSKAQNLDVPSDVSDRYNKTASTFDAEVELAEKAMRMGSKRSDLVRMARGDVLEVSCGTGRNLEYYELGERRGVDEEGRAAVRGCRSLTFVDLSPQMVDITREKFEKLRPEFRRAAFRAQDAGAVSVELGSFRDSDSSSGSGKISRKDKGQYYDTIVQTMGLCSVPDPVGTLRHLGSITEPNRGRILLLEHGRSYYAWLNRILDNLAPAHADRHGCWWNRDIEAIVRESGLEVVEEKRWHFGTTWRFVLRPRQSPGPSGS